MPDGSKMLYLFMREFKRALKICIKAVSPMYHEVLIAKLCFILVGGEINP